MKRIYLIAFVFLIIATSWMSCRKDDSTLDLIKIPGVTFDTTGNSALNVFQFNHLIVNPKLKMEGLSEEDVSYKWRVNLAPSDTIYQLLSQEKNLDAEISLPPTQTGRFYQVYYTITDKKNGIDYIMTWPLTVKNSIGEGLVIAETKDNLTTDLSHIMSPLVTQDYTGESVKRAIYSSVNGKNIEGLVKQMRYMPVFAVNALFAITDNSIIRINTLDYTTFGVNNDLFFTPSPSYHPQSFGGFYQGEAYAGDGKITITNLGVVRKFGAPYDNKFIVPDHFITNSNSKNGSDPDKYTPSAILHFYDPVNGHFVYLNSLQFGDIIMRAYPSETGKAFNPGSLPGKTTLAAGMGGGRSYVHVLKDKTTSNTSMYLFDAGVVNPSTEAIVSPPAPVAVYDLSAAPGITNATKFVIMDNQKVMYYVSGNKIYAMLYTTSSPTFEERYTVPAGEEITTLQVYRQYGYPLLASYIATNNKQLIMSTYKGTEGKISLLPITNIGLGTIDNANIKTFSGFGKITAIAPQK